MIELIDVSTYQPVIDWPKVAASGVVGMYARSVWGSSPDSRSVQHRAGAKSAGLATGSYGVIVEGLDPTAQALAYVQQRMNDEALPPMLDLERGPSKQLAAAEVWCEVVEAALGRSCIVYTGDGWWQSVGNPPMSPLGARPLVLAAYVEDPARFVPPAWRDWTLWQYTGTGRVEGVSGNVDRSRFRGTLAELHALGTDAVCGPATQRSPA